MIISTYFHVGKYTFILLARHWGHGRKTISQFLVGIIFYPCFKLNYGIGNICQLIEAEWRIYASVN